MKEISPILSEAKGLAERANTLDIEGTFSNLQNAIKIVENKAESLKLGRFGVPYFDTTQSGQNEHENVNNQTEGDINRLFGMLKKFREEVDELKKAYEELKKSLEERKNKQTQSNGPNSSESSITATTLDKQKDEEKKAIEKHRLLKSKKRTKELEQENAKLEKELSEQEKADEWKKKINGKASEFFLYLLESIKLEEKDDKVEKVSEVTLRNFDNKVIIHWKDGSQTTFDIQKQDGLQAQPNTKIDFVDPDVHAAFEVACSGL